MVLPLIVIPSGSEVHYATIMFEQRARSAYSIPVVSIRSLGDVVRQSILPIARSKPKTTIN